jgi:hypothetical protein
MTKAVIASAVLDKALRPSFAEGVSRTSLTSAAVRSLSLFPPLLVRAASPCRRKRLQRFNKIPVNFRRCP